MPNECIICGGRRQITLPVRHPVTFQHGDNTPKVTEMSRTYPCPECGTPDNVQVLYAQQKFSNVAMERTISGKEMIVRTAKEQLARALSDSLLRHGCIIFTEYPQEDDLTIRGMLGVLKNPQSAIDAKIDDEASVAETAAGIAVRDINHWGSYYGDQSIEKHQATRFVRDAVRKAIEVKKGKPI